jgi:hypothetical protein
LLALAGVALHRSRGAAMLTIWAALVLLGWVSLTFIPGRFAVPLIVPLALLAGLTLEPRDTSLAGGATAGSTRLGAGRWPILLIALVGALANDVILLGRLSAHDRRWTARAGVPMRMLVGRTDLFVSGHPLNQALPGDAYAWLVGDAAVFHAPPRIHYTTPFNRDPWLEFAARGAGPQACFEWLRARGVSHVVFHWQEINRLRRTYGFSPVVTRDWVAQLKSAGLQRVRIDGSEGVAPPLEIYELPPPTAD